MNKVLCLILAVTAILSGCASYYSDSVGSVLMVGDSRVQMWPDDLCDKMDAENKGVGGTTSAFSADVLAKETDDYEAVIISVGINDSCSGQSVQRSLIELERAIINAGMITENVYITTIPSVRLGTGVNIERLGACFMYNDIINAKLPEIAARNGAKLIPLAELLNDEGGELSATYDDGSGIHYNAAGYAVIYELYMSYLEENK